MISHELSTNNFSFLPPTNFQRVQRIELKNSYNSYIKVFTIANECFQDSLENVLGARNSALDRLTHKSHASREQLGWRKRFKKKMHKWSLQLTNAYSHLSKKENRLRDCQKVLEKDPSNFITVKELTFTFCQLVVENAIWESRKGVVIALVNTKPALKSTKKVDLKNQQERIDLLFNTITHPDGEWILAVLKITATQLDVLKNKKPPFSQAEMDWLKEQMKLARKTQIETSNPVTKAFILQIRSKISAVFEKARADIIEAGRVAVATGNGQTLVKESKELLAELEVQKSSQITSNAMSYAMLSTHVEQFEVLICKIQTLQKTFLEEIEYPSYSLQVSLKELRNIKFRLQSYQLSTAVKMSTGVKVHFTCETIDSPNHSQLREFYEVSYRRPKAASQEEILFLDLIDTYLPSDMLHERKTVRNLFFIYLNQLENNKLSQNAKLRKKIDADRVLTEFKEWLSKNIEIKMELHPKQLFSKGNLQLKSYIQNFNYVKDQEFHIGQIQTDQWKSTETRELTLLSFQPIDLLVIHEALDKIWLNNGLRAALTRRLKTSPSPPLFLTHGVPVKPILHKVNRTQP